MNELFKHPVWLNKYSRSALLCLLALLPVVVLIAVLPGLDFILVRLACILMIAALVLVYIVYRQSRRESKHV